MAVDIATAKHKHDRDGAIYYFCGAGCRTKFIADPARYLPDAAPRPVLEAVPAGVIWTCPMHPQVLQDKSGACPFCGMALEPLRPTSNAAAANPELASMSRRFWASVPISLALLVIAMALPSTPPWIELCLASLVVLWGGAPFFARGWMSMVNRNPEYVHPDRTRHGHRLPLQPGRDAMAHVLSAGLSRRTRPRRRLFQIRLR